MVLPEATRCGACGAETAAGASGLCPTCLLELGLSGPGPAVLERLGPYVILSRLGVGGMGEVYRARDSRLDRDVAIKVLPDALAEDPERIARFRREARVAASLNHPNIAAIYGFEEDGGLHFLVMELVDGTMLNERLRAGPLSVEEALRIGAQITGALDAAHERDIVHRDLKPSNVKVTPEGTAKVLDFGLAKAVSDETSGPHEGAPAEEPHYTATITSQYTAPGVVMGTLPYMSPEQARGRHVDRRTDLWAFGCVLYECLTGRPAFEGETPSDVLARILEREPDWKALPARTPPRVRDLLERCLEKDPQRRLRDSGDARIELERALAAREWTTTAGFRAWGGRRPQARRLVPWAIAGAMTVLALVAGLRPWREGSSDAARQPHAPRVPMRVDLTDPSAPHRNLLGVPTVAISPDGTTIAYVGEGRSGDPGERSLYLRSADEIHARRVEVSAAVAPWPTPSGDNAGDPLFSLDGKWLYYSNWGLYRVPVSGGRSSVVSESAGMVKGATCLPNGIVFSPAAKAGLVFVPEGGGPLETLTVPDAAKGEVSHRWPSALPDGSHVLFTVKKEGIPSFDEAEIALLDLGTRRWTTILRGGSFARYLPTGHIVFAADGTLWVVPFDLREGKVRGAPVPVVEGVMTDPGSGAAQFSVAQHTGTLVFVPGGPEVPQVELVWVDRKGEITPVGAPLGNYDNIALSPDGTQLAVTVWGASDAVVVYDFTRRAMRRLTSEGNCSVTAWTPDGKRILFRSDRRGEQTLYMASADGSGNTVPVGVDFEAPALRFVVPLKHRTDLVYYERRGLWLVRLQDGAKPQRLSGIAEVDSNPSNPSVSPDGGWLAYDSDMSGRREVYVRPFPSGNGNWQVSTKGGSFPLWSPSGGELLYVEESQGRKRLQSVRVSAGSTGFTASPPVALFELPSDVELGGVHPEGERFIARRRLEPRFKGDRIEAILNWFDQVAARVPKGRTP